MKRIILTLAILLCAAVGSAQNVAAMKSRLAAGANPVTVTEQSDVAQAVRSVEQRPARTKVSGFTILILSDNSQTARENANKA